MFTLALRQEYESLYEQITGLGMPVKSSSLLQTYATILAITNTPASSFEDAYRNVRTMYSGYELALCSKIKPPFSFTFSALAVLNGTKMPAVLVECGYMSNDLRYCRDNYKKIAYAIYRGILNYFA